jgi:hypothetical protein
VAHRLHQEVRRLYRYQCGYCNASETEAGGELTVDHYYPSVAGGSDELENLIYACFRCNTNKGDELPFISGAEPEQRILHPLRDDLAAHFQVDDFGLAVPLTETGLLHITTLELNRPALVRFRWRRQTAAFMAAELRAARKEIEEQRVIIQSQNDLIRVLEELVARYTGNNDPTNS